MTDGAFVGNDWFTGIGASRTWWDSDSRVELMRLLQSAEILKINRIATKIKNTYFDFI